MVWQRWIEPRSTDEHTARQEQLVNILSVGGAAAGLAFLLAVLIQSLFAWADTSIASAIGGVLCTGLSTTAYLLSRRGLVRLGAIAVVATATLVGLYAVYMRGALSVAAVVLAPAAVFAGIALGGRAGFLTALVEFLLYTGLALAEAQGWIQPIIGHSPFTGMALVAIALALLALVAWQTVRSMGGSLQRTRDRGQALQVLAEEKDRLLTELQAREEAQRRLLEMVGELGSPVIPLAEGIIAMPLIGIIDSERAQQLRMALLDGVAAHRARVAIVDITGVPLVDTMVAGTLLQAAKGIRLLGAEPVLTGIRAEVAQTIVSLGLDLTGVVTRATLQEGLTYAIAEKRVE